ERTGRGIAHAEGRELRGGLLRQNDQVGLLVRRTVSAGRAAPYATARSGPHVRGRRHRLHSMLPLRQPISPSRQEVQWAHPPAGSFAVATDHLGVSCRTRSCCASRRRRWCFAPCKHSSSNVSLTFLSSVAYTTLV